MDRYLVESRITLVYGLDAKREKDAKKAALAEVSNLIERLNQTENLGVGAKFETSQYNITVEKLPF